MLTVTPAQLSFDNKGIPYSTQFSDSYYSSSGPIEECKHVFIGGNGILTRWNSDRHFTIAELGFGLGLNFLVTGNAWISRSSDSGFLHYISIEKHPPRVEDLKAFYSRLQFTSILRDSLIEQYPLPVAGIHTIRFEKLCIRLSLIWEDALSALKDSNFLADAWYLDGFSPSKNPQIWSQDISRQIFRLTQEGGTFATYSVAGFVSNNFSNAGFCIQKQPGFARKREMLTGSKIIADNKEHYTLAEKSWLISTPSKINPGDAIVIGAGLAGSAISESLARRNWQVTIIDRHPAPAQEGSGNKNAILMPRLSVDHDLQAQLTLLGFFYTQRYLKNLERDCGKTLWNDCGAIQLPRDQTQWQRMQKIISQEILPPELVITVNKKEASELSNCELAHDGWHFPSAGWIIPALVCSAIQQSFREEITFIGSTSIARIKQEESVWHVFDRDNKEIAKADIVVLANAFCANQLTQTHWCTLHPKRGQVTLISESNCNVCPDKIICADAYITPALNNELAVGATFITGDTQTDVRSNEHLQNIKNIQKIIPAFHISNTENLTGRAAIRAVSADRLPVVGPVTDKTSFNHTYATAALGATHVPYPAPNYLEGLYLATGFGSRGLAWIPLCAEALACQINNEPPPLGQSLLNAIHPNRILMKQLVKSVQ